LQTTDADAGTSDAADPGAIYTGTIDTTPPDNFEWKSVSENKLTVSSMTVTHVSVQSKPFTDINSFHDLDSHAAEVINLCLDANLHCIIVTLLILLLTTLSLVPEPLLLSLFFFAFDMLMSSKITDIM